MSSNIHIVALIYTTVEILAVIAAVHAVMTTRMSQSAIAWGISLVTFPWVTLPLYAVFGRSKFKGYVSLRCIQNDNIRHVIEQCYEEAMENGLIEEESQLADITLMKLAELPPTRYNRCELLVNGPATFHSIFSSINAAEAYILVQFFIIKDDGIGQELKARLIAKAKQGVKVYLIYDEIGSYQLPAAYLQELRNAGIKVTAFNTTRGKANRFQINFRNHRKIVVTDGKVAFVGGHNVGDEYLSRHSKFGLWRDTHVKVEGPVVKAVQYSFLQDWYWATSTLVDLNWRFHRPKGGTAQTLMIASGPADQLDVCSLMFTHVINSAKERIWIASPYFVPDNQILVALKLAALRGVDVRILLPEKPDHWLVYLASFFFYENTLPIGIQLYRFTAGFMHQKVFLVDNAYAAVGTANLDNRSFRLNFELTLLNYDEIFVADVRQMLSNDFSRSRKVALKEITEKSYFFKVAVRLASLLSPIL